ncbi:MAG: CCA tRNA nucleotidyltransferase [Actinobacteria bacterium]|nr:CCA tRNA nucleotidyltransferase [Actinomycetota bacterium]
MRSWRGWCEPAPPWSWLQRVLRPPLPSDYVDCPPGHPNPGSSGAWGPQPHARPSVIPERLKPVIDATGELGERFAAKGHRLYLVGGVVRDALLDRLKGTNDLDLTTDATPDKTKAIVSGWADAVWDQGARFGTIGFMRRDVHFEVTTHRAEAYSPESRKPDVKFAPEVDADLWRRDFTVNAMALSLPDLQLHDPTGGAADLASGTLRTPLSPQESFGEDPLRMLRAARFIAGYNLTPEPRLVEAVKEMVERLEIVSAERIRDEFDKLIQLPETSAALWFLVETGLAGQFLPELPALALEQDPVHHHKDVLAHTIAVVDKTEPDKILRLAALMHDVGKPRTRAFGPGGVSFHHHDVVGARMTRERMTALRYPTEETEQVAKLVELHLRFHTFRFGWTDSAVRRYVRDAGPLLDRLNALTRADCTTRNQRKAQELAERMDALEERIAELRHKEELDSIRPDLDGNEVMEHLGVEPGKVVGEALNFLLELRLEEGPLGSEEARRRLDRWWAERRG